MARRRNKSEERTVAERRLAQLARLAGRELPARPDLADRYGQLALQLARKYQTGLPEGLKPLVCRKCGTFTSAANRRVRVRSGRVTATCLQCGHVRRRPVRP